METIKDMNSPCCDAEIKITDKLQTVLGVIPRMILCSHCGKELKLVNVTYGEKVIKKMLLTKPQIESREKLNSKNKKSYIKIKIEGELKLIK